MTELMTIVNEKDKIIGYKERGTLDYKNEIYRISSLRLENSKGEVLIAQRSLKKKNQAGIRGPAVSGTVNDKESYEQNILKEAQEEIGLKLINYKLGPKQFIKSTNQNRKYFNQRFIAKTDKTIEEFTLQQEEVNAIKRISKEDLLNWLAEKPKEFTSSANNYITMFCK